MRRAAAFILAVALAGCATKLGKDGRAETSFDVKYLAKTEVDRVTDTIRSEVTSGLLLIADKLYRRNPREWRKGGAVSREAAVAHLRARQTQPFPELGGARERHAAALAFSENYTGDRVAALVFGLLTMSDAAFAHKEEFFILDSLDEQKLNNTARNFEIALWKLNGDRTPAGQPYLLANELDPNNPNLSFEREFGRQIGLLDLMANIVADRHGRTLSRASQSVATYLFLPVSF
jgi:hypothetical protein